MIVADTQMLVYLTTPVPESAAAQDVLAIDSQWAVPRLWRSEFRNALLGYLRAGRMEVADAAAAYERAAVVIGDREHEVDTATLLKLAADNRITAYDLEFVVLAQALQVPLVTFDREVLLAFPEIARRPEEFVRNQNSAPPSP